MSAHADRREHSCPRCDVELLWSDGWGYRCPFCLMFVCVPRKARAAAEEDTNGRV